MLGAQSAVFPQQAANVLAIPAPNLCQHARCFDGEPSIDQSQTPMAPTGEKRRPEVQRLWPVPIQAERVRQIERYVAATGAPNGTTGSVLERLTYLTSPHHAARVIHAEAKNLLSSGRLRDARRLLNVALRLSPDDPTLVRLGIVIAPNRVTKSTARGTNRVAEFNWLLHHRSEFLDQWVALRGEVLLAHAETLKDLKIQLESDSGEMRPFIHHVSSGATNA